MPTIAWNLVRATDRYNTTLTFAYDAANRMIRRTDRRGYSFHFEYDDQGRCIDLRGDDGLLEVFLDYEPDANTTFVQRGDGGQWIYAYNDQKTITQITDPYGHATKFILDDSGRPVQEVDPNGNVTILHYSRLGEHDYRIDPNGHRLPTLGTPIPIRLIRWRTSFPRRRSNGISAVWWMPRSFSLPGQSIPSWPSSRRRCSIQSWA